MPIAIHIDLENSRIHMQSCNSVTNVTHQVLLYTCPCNLRDMHCTLFYIIA